MEIMDDYMGNGYKTTLTMISAFTAGIIVMTDALATTYLSTPPSGLEGERVKLELRQTRAPGLRWEVRVYSRVSNKKPWIYYFDATLIGNFKDARFAKRFRKAHNVYYPFGEAEQILDIKTSEKQLVFRVKVFDKYWIDSKVTILGATPFVLFECVGVSNIELTPHWRVTYAKTPLFELVTEGMVKSNGTSSLNAKSAAGNHIYASFAKYCAAFKKGDDDFFAILNPRSGKKVRVQFPRKQGVKSAYLNAPFILYGGKMKFDKTPHAVAHVAEGLHSEMLNAVSRETAK